MKRHVRLAPAQVIILGFALLIALGTALLSLPFATRGSGGAPLETAFFTAVSASCVTGLAIEDTALYWTSFGHAVILTLIQIGGMGVVTMAILIIMFTGRKIGLTQRRLMQESISAPQVGGIIKMTGMIIRTMLAVEGVGALLLACRFCPQLGLWRGLWYGLFHSVSAFCNAGFDLMGTPGAPCVSLTGYTGDALVCVTVALLILIGNIGFSTWQDMREHRFKLRRYSLQSKLILAVSAVLVLGGFAFNYFYEFARAVWGGLDAGARALAALFQTVTPRTAGFNTVELGSMSRAGQLFMLMQMLIGGAPGSTAGGFKMTTIAVLALCVKAAFQGKSSAEAFGRRIPDSAVKNAAALFLLYILLFVSAGLFINCVDGVPLMAALFESGSAVATVGLSLGITARLCTASHILLAALMFFGRVGGLTLIYAVTAADEPDVARLPLERVAIG